MPLWDKALNVGWICAWLIAFSAFVYTVYNTPWHPLPPPSVTHMTTGPMGIPLPGVYHEN